MRALNGSRVHHANAHRRYLGLHYHAGERALTIHSLDDHRAERRAAAEAVFSDVVREIAAARDQIMCRALRRLAINDRGAELQVTIARLGALWVDAWPFESPR